MPANAQLKKEIEEGKMMVAGALDSFDKVKAGAGASARQALGFLNKADQYLLHLEQLFNKLMVAQNTLEERQGVQDQWHMFYVEYEQKIYDGKKHQEGMPGAAAPVQAPPADALITAAKAKLDEKVKMITQDLKDFEAAIAEVEQRDEDNPISKSQWAAFNRWLQDIKISIWPGLENLSEKVSQLDMAKTGEHQAALAAHYKTVSPEYRRQVGKFAALPSPNDPAQQPDVNDSVISAVSEPSAARTTETDTFKQFKLKAKDPPTFRGDVLDYGHWKNIWLTHVIPKNHDSWVIKALAEDYLKLDDPLTARKIKGMKTAKEAIIFLDSIFANPITVSETVTSNFLAITKSSLTGSTREQKVLALEVEISNLLLRLESIKEEDQLKGNIHLIRHAINLLPGTYKRQFGERRYKAVRDSKAQHNVFGTKDLFALLVNFLEEKAVQIREYEPETLVTKSNKKSGIKLHHRDGTDVPDFSESDSANGGVSSDEEIKASSEATSDEEIKANSEDTSDEEIKPKKTVTSGRNKKKVNNRSSHASPPPQTSRGGGSGSSPEDKIKMKQQQFGPCPVCDGTHVWSSRRGHKGASQSVADCRDFRMMVTDDRAADVKKHKICRRCLSWGHSVHNCDKKKGEFKCKKKVGPNDEICGGDHHTLLHGSHLKCGHRRGLAQPQISLSTNQSENTYQGDVMLAIVKVQLTPTVSSNALLDGGSNCSLITHGLAKSLGLKGVRIQQTVELAGKPPEIQDVAYYQLRLPTPDGLITLRMVGLDRITSNPGSCDLTVAYSLFPHLDPGSIDRPDGEIGLLFGTDCVKLLPTGGTGINQVGNLRVYDILLPPYKVLAGSHPDIEYVNPEPSPLASNLRSASFYLPQHSLRPAPACLNTFAVPVDFTQAEELGFDTPAKCKKCRACKPGYRLARVLSVKYDEDGLVRTVVAGVRPQSKKDHSTSDFVPKKPEKITLPVQRVVVLLAVEHQHELPEADDQLHVCPEEVRVSALPVPPVTSQPQHTVPGQDVSELDVAIPAKLVANVVNLADAGPYSCSDCVLQLTAWQSSSSHPVPFPSSSTS